MNFDDLQEQPILLLSVLGKAFEHYKKEFRFFISISLVFALLSELGNFLVVRLSAETQEYMMLRAFVNIVIACWASIAIIYAASCLATQKKFKAARALRMAQKRYFRYMTAYLAMLSVVICGFFLFVVPGLYFMTIFLFVDILVVVDNLNFQQAFQRSARMIRPFFWKTFIYLFMIVSISLVPEVIHQIGLNVSSALALPLQKIAAVFIMPFLMIAQVEFFYQIKRKIKLELSPLEDQINSVMHEHD